MLENDIAILMATYNGEKYLREQIDSLLNQTCQDWHLYVHDDGSKDGTVNIVKSYAERYPDKVTLLDYPPQGGACRNFLSLLEKAEARYYMFCDQDDVWLPEKIALSLEEMKRQEALHLQKPVVIHTDLHIVDDKLTVIGKADFDAAPNSTELKVEMRLTRAEAEKIANKIIHFLATSDAEELILDLNDED